MWDRVERRHHCEHIIGVERRGAPIHTLEGHPLPDPTLLLDEEFRKADLELQNVGAEVGGSPKD